MYYFFALLPAGIRLRIANLATNPSPSVEKAGKMELTSLTLAFVIVTALLLTEIGFGSLTLRSAG